MNVKPFIWKTTLAATNAAQPAREQRAGRARVNAKLTNEQVLEVLHLRDRRGWSAARIATKLKITPSQAAGVFDRGCGIRTVVLKQR